MRLDDSFVASFSPQNSKNLLNILADLNNIVVWMFLIYSMISNYSRFFFQFFGDCSNLTNHNWYHVTLT